MARKMGNTDQDTQKIFSSAGQLLGRSGKGGKAAAAALTPEERQERARAAGKARWAGHVPQPRRERLSPGARKLLGEALAMGPVAVPLRYDGKLNYRLLAAEKLQARGLVTISAPLGPALAQHVIVAVVR